VGDIDLHKIDLLNIFWEPGITDIEKSRYLFVVDLADRADTEARYPQFAGKLGGSVIDLAQYVYDDESTPLTRCSLSTATTSEDLTGARCCIHDDSFAVCSSSLPPERGKVQRAWTL
jgi:hypothetical protein